MSALDQKLSADLTVIVPAAGVGARAGATVRNSTSYWAMITFWMSPSIACLRRFRIPLSMSPCIPGTSGGSHPVVPRIREFGPVRVAVRGRSQCGPDWQP